MKRYLLLRKMRYCLHYWFGERALIKLPLTMLSRGLEASVTRERFDGIALYSLSLDPRLHEPFMAATREALELIRRTAPRRFHTIQREIKEIVGGELTAWASYDRTLRCCNINFGRAYQEWSEEHREWHIAAYASTLVHEATHGRLCSRFIPYTWSLRARLDLLCRLEEQRFAARLPRDRYDFAEHLVPGFDEADWQSMWTASTRQKNRDLWVRIQQARIDGAQGGNSRPKDTDP